MPKFNVLVLLSLYTHVIANRLNLKYTHCAVMAEWLTHLTTDVGGTQFEYLRIPVINFKPLDDRMLMFVWVFFLPPIVKGLTTRGQGIHSITIFTKLTTK